MHRLRMLLLLSLSFLPSACATAEASFEPLSADHPASPRAPVAPIADPSACLRTGELAATGAEDAALPPTPAAPAAGAYVCPMHEEVSADEPGRCPLCGMALVRREPPAHASEDHPRGD